MLIQCFYLAALVISCQEGNMPLEELLAIYRYEASAGSSIDSSSGDLTDELPDMTLDKVCNHFYMAALHRP